MSAVPAKSGSRPASGVPARGYSWAPFQPGHALSRKHGFYSLWALKEAQPEIDEIAEWLRDLMPIRAATFEVVVQVTAGRLWRLRAAYRFMEEKPGEVSTRFLENVNALENVVSRSLSRLGMDPLAAAELGISLKALAAGSDDGTPPFNWDALDVKERRTLERLIAKGRRPVDDGD